DTAYTYDAGGQLLTRSSGGQLTAYDYDELGNLRGVTPPTGSRIEYVVDGRNRRIGKRVNGVLTPGWPHRSPPNPLARLDRGGNVVRTFGYGTRDHVPDYLERDGRLSRIVADQLGSPRLVVDAATGVVRQRMDYDEFGRVVLDTNPGFQPFGFAGGLYDPDTG